MKISALERQPPICGQLPVFLRRLPFRVNRSHPNVSSCRNGNVEDQPLNPEKLEK
jgi:hypothetical protein